jgi:hypothetical protein
MSKFDMTSRDSIELDKRYKDVVIDTKNNFIFLLVACSMFFNWKYVFVFFFILYLLLES